MECNKCKKWLHPGDGNRYYDEILLCNNCNEEFSYIVRREVSKLLEDFIQPERLSEKSNLDLKNPLEPGEKMGFPKFEYSSKEMNEQWVLDPDCMR